MTDFGRHSNLVQEVVDFFNNGSLLTAAHRPPGLDVLVIDALPEDMWQSGPGGRTSDILDIGVLTYGDIQEKARSKIMGAVPLPERQRLDVEFAFGSDGFITIIGNRLRPSFYDHAETIADNLRGAAQGRQAFGASDGLFERMFHVYRAGGMPCGYVGEFPRAYQMMAVFPGIETPSKRSPQRPTYAQYLLKNRGY